MNKLSRKPAAPIGSVNDNAIDISDRPDISRIRDRLVKYGERKFRQKPKDVFFTDAPEANHLVNDLSNYPHAYVLGCIADRQIKAELAWAIPYRLQESLGTFAFSRLAELTVEELRVLMNQPKPLHRYSDTMAELFHLAIERIAKNYDGVASNIWRDRPSSAEVVYRFLQFKGIGQKIASMAANILARDFKIPMSDRYSIDISVDRHIKRVCLRLEIVPPDANNEQIIFRARALHPVYPGLLDLPCFEIGRTWCKPNNPNCSDCFMNDLCPFRK